MIKLKFKLVKSINIEDFEKQLEEISNKHTVLTTDYTPIVTAINKVTLTALVKYVEKDPESK